MEKVIIVGGGISGLVARKVLFMNGTPSFLIEKSRGLGGRCATRRFEGGFADHGAQFTRLKSENWNLLNQSQRDELHPVHFNPHSAHPRFIHPEGISKLARFFDVPGELAFQTKIVRVSVDQKTFSVPVNRLESDQGKIFFARELLLTAPLPQSLEWLEECGDEITQAKDWEELKKVQYDPCIAMLVETDLPLESQERDGIFKNLSANIIGVYDQKRKGLKSEAPTLVIHASPAMSLLHWMSDDAQIEAVLWKELEQLDPEKFISLKVKKTTIHRWKYSEPRHLHSSPFVCIERQGARIWFAGDSFLRSSVEGALDSGVAVANAMKAYL